MKLMKIKFLICMDPFQDLGPNFLFVICILFLKEGANPVSFKVLGLLLGGCMG